MMYKSRTCSLLFSLQPSNSESLVLMVSYKQKPFRQAQFPQSSDGQRLIEKVCVYIRVYVRTYVCMYVQHVCMYIRMYVCMYIRMYVRTYVMYMYTYT